MNRFKEVSFGAKFKMDTLSIESLNTGIPIIGMLLLLHPLIWAPSHGLALRLASFLFIGLTSLLIITRRKLFLPDYSLKYLALFLIAAFISAVFSQYPGEAWLGHPGYVTGFYAYICFSAIFILAFNVAINYPSELKKILRYWIYITSGIAFLGLLQYFGVNLLPYNHLEVFQVNNSYSTIGNTNDLGTYLLMAFPFAAYYFLKKPDLKNTIIISLIYGSFLTTLCRSAWIGLGVGFLILFFYYPKKNNILALMLVLIVVTAVLLPMHNWKLLNQVVSISDETEQTIAGEPEAGSTRMLLWQEGFNALPNSLLIGSGPDTFYYVAEEKFEERWWPGARPASKAHNIFLEIAVTMGIPAMIFYILFLFSIMVKTDLSNPLQFAFFLMVVTYMVRGLFLVDVISVYPIFWALLGFYQGVKKVPEYYLQG